MVKYLENNSGFSQWMKNQTARAENSKSRSLFGTIVWWMILFLGIFMLLSYISGSEEKSEITPAEIETVADLPNVPTTPIEGEKISAQLRGLQISNVDLHNYAADKKSDANVVLLGDGYVQVGLNAVGTVAPTTDTVWRSTRMAANNSQMWRNLDGIDFTRSVTVQDYTIIIRDDVKNNTNRDVSFAPYARIVDVAGKDNAAVNTGAYVFANGDREFEDWSDLGKRAYAYQTVSGYAGFADQYWETIAAVDSPDQTITVKSVADKYQVDINAGPVTVSAGAIKTFETKIFVGPRDPSALAAAPIANLSDTMDYGWFWFLARPMLWALNALHGFIGNYGIAIILLTIFIRLLMWPLTRKSYTSMAAMQKMQPEMQRIQKLYKDDKARMQMEMMRLYQTHKTSPMSGCLPMLLQIPIFFALYKALLISVPMRLAGFLWIPDLSAMDSFFILPIIMGATMWYQQRLQSAAPKSDTNDPSAAMQRAMRWMPLIFTILFAWMPAGLVLYWTVSNMFGILQMWVIRRTA